MKYLVRQITDNKGRPVRRFAEFHYSNEELNLNKLMYIKSNDKKKCGNYVVLEKVE